MAEDCKHDGGRYEDTITSQDGSQTARISRCSKCHAMTSSRGV